MTLRIIFSTLRRVYSVQSEYRFFRSLLGGDYHYDQFSVDGKYYIPLSRTLTLAVAGNYQSLTHHDKRLTPMARPYIELRGISRYRYQGDYVSTAQTQLAWEFQPRWILQGFVGIGSAADEGPFSVGANRRGVGDRVSLPDSAPVWITDGD